MKILKYFVIPLTALSMASCNDFFDTESPSSMDDVVYKSPEQTKLVIAGIYNEFLQDKSYRNRLNFMIGTNSDIEYNAKSSNNSYSQLTMYGSLTTNSEMSVSGGKDPWGYLTSAAARAAAAIDGIERNADLGNPVFAYALGEAYFLRGFITLEMVKLWGDVPVIKSIESYTSDKRDRNEAFELIRSDFKKAIEYLPNSADCPDEAQNNVSRPSKSAAYALLARADLYYAGYALRPNTFTKGGTADCSVQFNVKDASKRAELYKEAMDACKAIIDVDDAKFKTNFEDIFKDLCKDVIAYDKTEYIWVMPMNDGSRGQFLQYNCPKMDGALTALKNNQSGSSNSTNQVVPTLVYDFDKADLRKWVTIAPYKWVCDKGSGISGTAETVQKIFPGYNGTDNVVYQSKQDINGFYLGKYRVEWMSRVRNGSDDGVDYPVVRYGDVLLMYAEAAIGSMEGNVPSGADAGLAQTCYDRIRSRAGLASQPLTMDGIIKERAFELCGENLRKFDLIRWGVFEQYMKRAAERLNELNLHTGEFADTGDEIYFKYKQNDELLYAGGKATHAYEMDLEKTYGLAHGENEQPADYDTDESWLKKNLFAKDNGSRHLATYKLFFDDSPIGMRQYWPIFNQNVAASDGSLWNDYGY